jgi:hypothetical protein
MKGLLIAPIPKAIVEALFPSAPNTESGGQEFSLLQVLGYSRNHWQILEKTA